MSWRRHVVWRNTRQADRLKSGHTWGNRLGGKKGMQKQGSREAGVGKEEGTCMPHVSQGWHNTETNGFLLFFFAFMSHSVKIYDICIGYTQMVCSETFC